MNKRTHRSVTIESLMSEPEPRARVVCLTDGHTVQLRVSKGSGHRTVTMSISAWRHLVAGVEERIAEPARPAA